MFHVGDVNILRSQALAAAAKKAGADSILISPPCVLRPTSLEVLVDIVAMVAAESQGLPCYFDHNAGLYHVNFSMVRYFATRRQVFL